MIQETKNEYIIALLKVINKFSSYFIRVYEFEYPEEGNANFIVRTTIGCDLVYDNVNDTIIRLVDMLKESVNIL